MRNRTRRRGGDSERSAKDLKAVVDFYDVRFHIAFTEQEKRDLVAFLSAL